MATEAEYEASILAAEQELRRAQTADDVRNVWRSHANLLGHRTLGRLLTGRSAEELLTRRDERAQGV